MVFVEDALRLMKLHSGSWLWPDLPLTPGLKDVAFHHADPELQNTKK
jgi:hypothetical protein